MAGKCNAGGTIFITENIPYTEEDLADELDFEIYRQDLATGMFTIPFLVSYRDDETVDYYRDYKYFVVNKNRLSSETLAELPTSPEENVYMMKYNDLRVCKL